MDRTSLMGVDRWLQELLRAPVRRHYLLSLVDAFLVAMAFVAIRTLRLAGWVPLGSHAPFGADLVFIALTYVSTNALFGVYRRIWRHACFRDVLTLAAGAGSATLLVAMADLLWGVTRPVPSGHPYLEGVTALALMLSVRFRHVLLDRIPIRRDDAIVARDRRVRALIVGAGDHGCRLARHLQMDPVQKTRYEVVGFVDDDQGKVGLRTNGLSILGTRRDIPDITEAHAVDQIIIASSTSFGDSFDELVSICQSTSAQIKTVPRFCDLLDTQGPLPNLRPLTIEDLLEREPVCVDGDYCRNALGNRVILVTGAAGSIGSELCRQLMRFGSKRLVMVDNNESSLHDLTQELAGLARGGPAPDIQSIVGDITNLHKMELIFSHEAPQIVFHAAAYKHVPDMEEHPDEAVRVNVVGTLILSELAQAHGVERFILISTDKAVNPSCVMGASKRLGEKWVAALSEESYTQFAIVRFGNVVGSRGSVIPIFERQIERGGPVTVTDPRMTRYFMSIPEAASLIIEAGSFSEGGVYMLDMGRPIQIVDLARKMIRLRGLRPDHDIHIKYIGVRPGEKLTEELAYETEEKLPTVHPRIFRLADPDAPGKALLAQQIAVLIAASQSTREMVSRLRTGIVLAASGDVDGCLATLAACSLDSQTRLDIAQPVTLAESAASDALVEMGGNSQGWHAQARDR